MILENRNRIAEVEKFRKQIHQNIPKNDWDTRYWEVEKDLKNPKRFWQKLIQWDCNVEQFNCLVWYLENWEIWFWESERYSGRLLCVLSSQVLKFSSSQVLNLLDNTKSYSIQRSIHFPLSTVFLNDVSERHFSMIFDNYPSIFSIYTFSSLKRSFLCILTQNIFIFNTKRVHYIPKTT